MSQDYAEGRLYEDLTKEIFELVGLKIQIFDYSINPEKQNEGIDAEVIFPEELMGITLQIKMFKNTNKYGTFPWEVSRYIQEKKEFVDEPHNADFHIIIDPINLDSNRIKIFFWVIKTQNLPNYYNTLWKEAIQLFGIPSENSSKWQKVKGMIEPYYRLFYKNETLYQLKLRHTAYQRNVRCVLIRLTDFLKFEMIVPSEMIDNLKKAGIETTRYKNILGSQDNWSSKLIKYLKSIKDMQEGRS